MYTFEHFFLLDARQFVHPWGKILGYYLTMKMFFRSQFKHL